MRPRLTVCLALLSLGLFSSCALEEHREWGVLHLSVEDALFSDAEIREAQVYLNDQLRATYTFGSDTRSLSINNLDVDRSWSVRVEAEYYESWSATLEFGGGGAETLTASLERAVNQDAVRTTIRTFTGDGVEMDGLPLTINGETWGFRTPTLVELAPGVPNTIRVAEEDCERGEIVLTLQDDDPSRVDTLWITDQLLPVETGHEEAMLLLDGTEIDLSAGSLLNPAPGSFLSAWRPGHVYQAGAPRILSGMCDDSPVFEWTALAEGFGEGQQLPDFSLDRADEGQLAYHAYRGRVVLVNFWFINCVPCQEELPMLQDVLTEYRDEGFRIVALNPVESENAQRQWVADHPEYTLDFLLDLGAAPVAGDAAITYFPTNFVVDRRGVIRQVSGELHREDFEPLVQQLLAE